MAILSRLVVVSSIVRNTISIRRFGRGKKIPVFGHGRHPYTRGDQFRTYLVSTAFLAVFINWKFLFKWFGVETEGPNVNFMVRVLCHCPEAIEESLSQPDLEDIKKIPSSLPYIMTERESDMKRFLLQEARLRFSGEELERLEKRITEVDLTDPDVISILKRNYPYSPHDPETFQEKKELFQKIYRKRGFFSILAESEENLSSEEEEDEEGEVVGKGWSYRERQIIDYENRIRQYSTPDKIFRYFATIKVTDDKGFSEVMMTPQDFLRSLTPGEKQPEAYGLDNYMQMTIEEVFSRSKKMGVKDESSIFSHLGSGGLISFSDFIFLLTVLATSQRHFEIAFKMFDLNGDGNVDVKEFEFVMNLMKSQSNMGAKHRDHQSSTFKGINYGLISYLFGPNHDQLLTVEKFIHFQNQLKREILVLEFRRKIVSPENDAISERDFADLLISYAGFTPTKRQRMMKRVSKVKGRGICLEDYLNFYQVLYNINDIDAALTFFHIAGASIERKTLKHVASAVAGVELSDHILEVVFTLFDENGDGKLSNREFLSVMKQRAMRGLEKPKDTGAGKMFNAIVTCAKSAALAKL